MNAVKIANNYPPLCAQFSNYAGSVRGDLAKEGVTLLVCFVVPASEVVGL